MMDQKETKPTPQTEEKDVKKSLPTTPTRSRRSKTPTRETTPKKETTAPKKEATPKKENKDANVEVPLNELSTFHNLHDKTETVVKSLCEKNKESTEGSKYEMIGRLAKHYTKLSQRQLERFTLDQLKDISKGAGKSTEGKKAQLIEAICPKKESEKKVDSKTRSSTTSSTDKNVEASPQRRSSRNKSKDTKDEPEKRKREEEKPAEETPKKKKKTSYPLDNEKFTKEGKPLKIKIGEENFNLEPIMVTSKTCGYALKGKEVKLKVLDQNVAFTVNVEIKLKRVSDEKEDEEMKE